MLPPQTPIPGPTPAAAIVLTAGPTHATVLMSALIQAGAFPTVSSSMLLLLESAVGVAESPAVVHKRILVYISLYSISNRELKGHQL